MLQSRHFYQITNKCWLAEDILADEQINKDRCSIQGMNIHKGYLTRFQFINFEYNETRYANRLAMKWEYFGQGNIPFLIAALIIIIIIARPFRTGLTDNEMNSLTQIEMMFKPSSSYFRWWPLIEVTLPPPTVLESESEAGKKNKQDPRFSIYSTTIS